LKRLKGVTEPERKRKIIGKTFIEVFQAATKRAGKAKFLAQGTLYPDVIESVPMAQSGCDDQEPPQRRRPAEDHEISTRRTLKRLFKDEVRGWDGLGLPQEIVLRQPFPGPGLAVRILGEVTPERLKILRNADAIVVGE